MKEAQELLDMQEEIEEAKQKESNLSGQLEIHMKKLKEIKCKDINEAKEILSSLEKEKETKEEEFKKGIKELKEKYEWEN